MKVDERPFAQLLGIMCIKEAFFPLQGNSPSHGLVEVGQSEAIEMLPPDSLVGVDYERVRLFTHPDGPPRRRGGRRWDKNLKLHLGSRAIRRKCIKKCGFFTGLRRSCGR
jgi:hypothetical protein